MYYVIKVYATKENMLSSILPTILPDILLVFLKFKEQHNGITCVSNINLIDTKYIH